MAIIEIAHGHITVADLNDGHTPSIDVGADGRLVIDGVPKGPSLKGEDAEAVARYEIQPSENSIMRDFKGALTPATLTARVFRDTGIAMEEVTPGGSNVLRYSIDGGTEQTYSPASGIATGGAKQKITLNFYVGAVRWASLDVPVLGIRAQLDSSGNLTIGEAVVNVKGQPGTAGASSFSWVRYSANADGSGMTDRPTDATRYIGHAVTTVNSCPAYTAFTWSKYFVAVSFDKTTNKIMLDGVAASDVLKGNDGDTPQIDPTTKKWKIGATLTDVLAEGTPGTPGKDFKYSDFTAAQLDALQSGVKSKIDTSSFRSDIKTLLKGDSAFVAATKGDPGTPGTDGQPGTPGKDFKYTDFTAAQLDTLMSGVKSKIDTSAFRSDIKTLLKGDSAFVAATKGATGAQGFGVKVVEWVGSTTLATAKGWVGNTNTYTCKSSDTLTSLRVGDTVHILTVLSDQGSKKGYVVGTCSQKSGTQVSVASVEAFIFGDKGDTGPQGPKGDKPIVTLGTDGYLVIDGTKQSTLLKGKDGRDGTNGTNGKTFRPSFSGETLVFTASTDVSNVSLSGIASKTYVTGLGYQTAANVNTIINGKGFATAAALNSVQSSIPTKVSQLSNDANYTRERLIANRGDYQHIVILLWKDAELAAHRIQGKLFTTGGGVSRHQVVDLDLWFSRWSSSGYDYSFRFDAYGQATPFELVTCTYQGATWWGIRHTSSQAIAIYFQGTDSGVSWNTVHYYTSNTNAVANSEINSSILSKSALVYNIVNKVGAKLDTATFNTEKTALQNAIAAKTDLATVKSNCYVKTEIDTKVTALNTAIGTKLTQAQVDARVTSIVPAWARATAKPGYSFSELTGSATAAQIPSLDASKITAGTLGADRIPSLNASKITAGTLGADRIPTLAIAKVSGLQTALDGKTTLAAVKALGYKDEAGVKALLTWSNVSSKPTLFSGKYSDLTGKPTIPSKVSELTNDSGYLYLSNGCVTDTAGTCSVLPYAAKSHTHTGYASSSHNHDTVYAAKSHKHNTIEATYSGSGGKQPPNYIGYNSLRSCMSNEEVNGNTQYKNWIYINAYSGADVGGTTAIGFNRQTMAAYLMRSEANASTWAEKAELLGTHNGLLFLSHMKMNWSSGPTIAHATTPVGSPGTVTADAKGFHFTAPAAWGLANNGTNAVLIANLIGTALPVTAYMLNQTIYVLWTSIGGTSARGNVELIVLRHHS